MRRREFLTIGCAAASWPVVGHAQQQITPLFGVLCTGTAEALERYLASFREGMHELGYVEGSNIRFEFRYADGYLDRLPDLANELVRLNPRVIVSTPLPANLAARKATSAIPIVMASGADPVGFGLVASLSHPGGNVTGLANFAEMLASMEDYKPRTVRGLITFVACTDTGGFTSIICRLSRSLRELCLSRYCAYPILNTSGTN